MGFAKAAPAKAAPAKAAAPVAKPAPAKKVAAKPAPVVVVEEVEEEAAPVARSRGPRGVSEEATITLLHEGNPKRAGTKAFEKFAAYVDGMTVAQFLEAVPNGTSTLVYDASHGYISIEGYDPEVIVKAEKPAKEPKAAPVAKPAKAAAPAKKGKSAPKADAESDMEVAEESAD